LETAKQCEYNLDTCYFLMISKTKFKSRLKVSIGNQIKGIYSRKLNQCQKSLFCKILKKYQSFGIKVFVGSFISYICYP
jgi:hypothetical protein